MDAENPLRQPIRVEASPFTGYGKQIGPNRWMHFVPIDRFNLSEGIFAVGAKLRHSL